MDVRELDVSTTTRGEVPEAAREYAIEKVSQLGRYTAKPILFAEVKLTLAANPARPRPAEAEATLDVNGAFVRAHVAAGQLEEAVDLLEQRLKRNLERAAARPDHSGARPLPDGEWRHGARPTERPEYFERPVEDREVVRHKSFALEPMTWEEAAFDLDVLGHGFYLFTEIGAEVECVVHLDDAGAVEVLPATDAAGEALRGDGGPAVGPAAATLTLAEAEERLDVGHERFVFFVDADSGRGNVVYRRYDGHYGLITPD